MNTIKIKKSELEKELASALDGCCGTDWDIYVDVNGTVDCRHNTHHANGDWAEIIDMYNMDCFDSDGKFPGDEGFDHSGAAEWIISETGWQPESVIFYNDAGENVYFDLQLVD